MYLRVEVIMHIRSSIGIYIQRPMSDCLIVKSETVSLLDYDFLSHC